MASPTLGRAAGHRQEPMETDATSEDRRVDFARKDRNLSATFFVLEDREVVSSLWTDRQTLTVDYVDVYL